MMLKYVPLLLLATLAGCGGSSKEIAQDKICVFATDEEAKACKSGQMTWFKPHSWGNEQLPLLVAASYCDFNYQVLMNNAGVLCVFTDKRMKAQGDAAGKK